MKIGVCTSLEHASELAIAGFDYVEENVQGFLIPEDTEEAFAAKLAVSSQSALPVAAANCFLPGALKCTGPAVDTERLVRYAETAFRRAQEAGIRRIVFGSGAARQIPDGFDRALALEQFISFSKRIAPLAAQYEVIVVIEPLNKKECNFINSLADGAEIVKAVNHPNLRLLADIYHMSMDHESPEEIIKHGALLQHVHVAELDGRMAPGTHGEDFGPFLRALKKINYAHNLSFECGWRQFPEQATESLEAFRRQTLLAGLE